MIIWSNTKSKAEGPALHFRKCVTMQTSNISRFQGLIYLSLYNTGLYNKIQAVASLCYTQNNKKQKKTINYGGVRQLRPFSFMGALSLFGDDATSRLHNAVIWISCSPLLFLFGFHSGSAQINASCARAEHMTVGVQLWSESDDYWACHDCPIMMGLGGLLNKVFQRWRLLLDQRGTWFCSRFPWQIYKDILDLGFFKNQRK